MRPLFWTIAYTKRTVTMFHSPFRMSLYIAMPASPAHSLGSLGKRTSTPVSQHLTPYPVCGVPRCGGAPMRPFPVPCGKPRHSGADFAS